LAPGREARCKPGRKMAAELNQEFLDWEHQSGDRPWFAFLNYYDAHDPYMPPRALERRFLGARQPRVHEITNLRVSDTAAVQSARALHDAALFSLDREIGRLLAELRSRGELERTVVVVTSDHGEEFGSHGLLGHGNSVYYSSIHVPLLVLYPGRVPSNLRFSTPVGTRNLAATLLDLARLPNAGYEGSSLAWTWGGAAPNRSPTAVISWVERNRNQPPDYPASKSELFSVITDSAQVILGADTVVFDLSTVEVDRRGHRGEAAFADDILFALRALRVLR
jgi:arylsulfatase A-like enzyme